MIITNSRSLFPTFPMDIQYNMESIHNFIMLLKTWHVQILFTYHYYLHLTCLHASGISLVNIYLVDMYL